MAAAPVDASHQRHGTVTFCTILPPALITWLQMNSLHCPCLRRTGTCGNSSADLLEDVPCSRLDGLSRILGLHVPAYSLEGSFCLWWLYHKLYSLRTHR